MSCRPTTVERGYADTRFGQSHYYRAIAPHQPRRPLVCFHMSPWSGAYFAPLLAAMGGDRPALAIDTPGYGNSDPPPEPASIEDYAAAMGDVLDALGIDEFDLLGDRTGAKIALEVARRRPRQTARLVLVSPVVWTAAELSQRREFAPETPSADGSHLASLWVLSAALSMQERSLEMLADIFPTRLQQNDIAHWGRRAAANYHEVEVLTQLAKPILVLRPRDDLWSLTGRIGEYLIDPQSRILELPEWGYDFLQAKAAETAGLLRDFLDVAALSPGVPAPGPAAGRR